MVGEIDRGEASEFVEQPPARHGGAPRAAFVPAPFVAATRGHDDVELQHRPKRSLWVVIVAPPSKRLPCRCASRSTRSGATVSRAWLPLDRRQRGAEETRPSLRTTPHAHGVDSAEHRDVLAAVARQVGPASFKGVRIRAAVRHGRADEASPRASTRSAGLPSGRCASRVAPARSRPGTPRRSARAAPQRTSAGRRQRRRRGRACRMRLPAAAAARPTIAPIATSAAPCRITSARTAPRWAPSAIRIAISPRLCATV